MSKASIILRFIVGAMMVICGMLAIKEMSNVKAGLSVLPNLKIENDALSFKSKKSDLSKLRHRLKSGRQLLQESQDSSPSGINCIPEPQFHPPPPPPADLPPPPPPANHPPPPPPPVNHVPPPPPALSENPPPNRYLYPPPIYAPPNFGNPPPISDVPPSVATPPPPGIVFNPPPPAATESPTTPITRTPRPLPFNIPLVVSLYLFAIVTSLAIYWSFTPAGRKHWSLTRR